MKRPSLMWISLLSLSATSTLVAEQLVPRNMQGRFTQPQAVQNRIPVRPAAQANTLAQPPKINSPQASAATPAGAVRRKAPVRRLASVESSSLRTRTKTSRNSGENLYRIGLVGGIGSMSSGFADNQTYRDDYQLGKNLVFGLQADLRFMKYLGVELDTYYGLAPSRTVEYSAVGSSDKVSLQQLGGLLNAKAQYPVYTGSIRWVPKLGLGYGMVKLINKLELASGTKYDISESFSGPFASIGFDVEPIHELVLMVDYARSISTTGKINVNENPEIALPGSNFSRLRVGGYFRAFDHVLLGGQYIMRSMSSDSEVNDGSGGVSTKETTNQMLGSVMFEF